MVKQEHQSIIELNGKRFNVLTGSPIESVSTPVSITKPTMNDIAPQRNMPRTVRASKQMHKSAQPSKTLMRRAVQKPSTITDRKIIAMDVVPQVPGQTTLDKFHSINPERIHRSEAIRQNTLVTRFGGELRSAFTPNTPQKNNAIQQPTQPNVQRIAPQPLQPLINSSATNKIIDKGLREATSHEAITAKKSKLHHRVGHKLGLSAKVTSIAVTSLAIVLIGGFATYQSVPALSVRYASAKAGVHASLPSYQPAGFTINSHVAYSPGQISVAYRANADSRAYTITQKSTNWNSDALKEHLMGVSGVIPQSYPDNGQTIYLHDNNSADWVNNGVWYSIKGNSSLNTDQLIKIATSL